MPLPTRKAPPTANPNAAQQPAAAASKGKSRLPAMPQGGLKAREQYNYISLPQSQEKGFYLLKLVSCEQFTAKKTNLEKLKFDFEVLDTNISGVATGSHVSNVLSLQGESSLYFWKNFAPIAIALAGGEVSNESYAEFEQDAEATFTAIVSIDGEGGGGLNGSIARCELRRTQMDVLDKAGNPTGEEKPWVFTDWYPATDAELKKYGTSE